MACDHYHSPEEMRDSIESLLGAHGRGRPVIYWALLLVTLVGLGSLPLIRVDTSVGAPGQVRPVVERFPVRPAVSGRIRTLVAADNQPVRQGQLLLELDASALEAQRAQNGFERDENRRALADLSALLEGDVWAGVLHALRNLGPELGSGAGQVATTLRGLPPPRLEHPAYQRQEALLRSDVQRSELKLSEALRKTARMQALHRKKLLSDQQYEDRVYATRAIIREIELMIQQALNDWQSDRAERELRASSLRSVAEQLGQQAELYRVVAPVDGTAIGFSSLHEGLFLPADQPIGEISPAGGLQADVFLSPGEIGFIRVHQAVLLQVDAFPYTEWGMVKGRVRSISQDFVQVGSRTAFRAVIDLEATRLRSSSGIAVDLRRGMTVQARFLLRKRTLFNLLFGKMSENLDPRAAGPAT